MIGVVNVKDVATFDIHTSDKTNPHKVTKGQVGLGNVDNTSDTNKPVSTAQANAIADAKSAGTTAQTQVSNHINNKANPHEVTKSQVGLGNVDNTSDANKPVSSAQSTAIADAKAAGTKAQTDLASHINNKLNPHSITPGQIGAAPVSHKHNASDISSGMLTFTYGGSSANTKEGANKNFTTYPLNSAPSSDLPDDYPEGVFLYTEDEDTALPYSVDDRVVIMSMRYGTEVSQMGYGMVWGGVYYRKGSGASWLNAGVTRGWTMLDRIVVGSVMAPNADYAEVAEWSDGNVDNEDRIGYFVSADLCPSGIGMVKATSKSDVRGVTMANPGFVANASKDKFQSEGVLHDKYDYVAFAGFVPVIDNGTCTVKGRCMPADDGTAVPSSNEYGYYVISRIDSSTIMILIEPSADMVQRLRTDVVSIEERVSEFEDRDIVIDETLSIKGAAAEASAVNAKFVKLNDDKVDRESGKGLSTNDFTDEEKSKLASIAPGANAYNLPTASTSTLGGVRSGSSVTESTGHMPCPIIGGVPYYKDTYIPYSEATISKNGLMSAADKEKLDGIDVGANAYTLPQATASVLGGVKVGSNLSISSGVISLTKANVTAALGYTPPTAYSAATQSAQGLMSAADKKKLDNISEYANAYTLTKENMASVLGFTPIKIIYSSSTPTVENGAIWVKPK